jgi:hypothetical protein
MQTGPAAAGAPMRLSKCEQIGIHRGTPELGEPEDYLCGQLLGMSGGHRDPLVVQLIPSQAP